MQYEVYKPPAATVIAPTIHERELSHYVVSIKKLVILFVATFGIYHVVWFYMHWSRYRTRTGADIWPLPRAIFSIFTAHGLFQAISGSMGQRIRGFQPRQQATLYVVLSIASNVLGRAGSSAGEAVNAIDLLSTVVGLAILAPLIAAQRAANEHAGDPTGSDNDRFTMANYLWCALGVVVWVFLGLSFFAPDLVVEGLFGFA